MNNSKKGIAIIVLLIFILGVVLTAGIIKDKKLSKENKDDYNNYIATIKDKDDSDTKDTESSKSNDDSSQSDNNDSGKEQNLNFYDKLKAKSPVKVLVLGDGIALSQGSTTSDGKWVEGLANFIKTTYGSEVEVKSLAKSGTKADEGLNIAKSNDLTGYDLVETCFGQNDNNAKTDAKAFKTSYLGIIDEIKSKNSNAVIIPVLSSTLDANNNYRKAISEIAQEKSLSAADVKQAFVDSGAEASLVTGSLPNDKGYKYYTLTIANIIKNKMA